MGRFKIRLYVKNAVAIVFLGWLVSINQACSINPKKQDLVQQDLQRIQHAHELLSKTYKKSDLQKFEGDFKLAAYIEKYIEKENSKLDAKELTETLLRVSREHRYDPVFLLAVIKNRK